MYPGIGEVARAPTGRSWGGPCGISPVTRGSASSWTSAGLPTAGNTHEVTFLTGLDLVEPGIVSCAHWRAEPGAVRVAQFGAMARKP